MAESEKWLTPANIIAIGAAVLGVAGVGFGVAFANPAGQRMLCGLNSFFCEDIAPSEGTLVVVGRYVDLDAACTNWLASLKGQIPPPGVSDPPTRGDCPGVGGVDLATYTHPLASLPAHAGGLVAAQLSFEHGEAPDDIPFTVAPLCAWEAPGGASLTEIPCRLEAIDDPAPLLYLPGAGPPPKKRIATKLSKGAQKYAEIWRIVWGEQDTPAALPPGRYSVKLNIATSPERVKESEGRFSFEVTP